MSSRFRRWLVAAAGLVVVAASAPVVSGATASAGESGTGSADIVGGKETTIDAHPYAVYLADTRGGQYCGGTLIGADTVLTAAHCAVAVEPEELRVVAGRRDQSTNAGVDVGVRDVWVSPEYQTPTKGDDVAVLKLDRGLPYYKPATLATGADAALYEPGTMATVVGWGRLSDGGARSDTVRSAQVPLVDDAQCGQAYNTYDPSSMVCAGYPEGGVDACQGDSGGPLLVGDTIIGVVSWGEGCGAKGKPGVYTRVSTYADAIGRA